MNAGPLDLLYNDRLHYFTDKGEGIDVEEQPKYEALAKDLGPKLAERIAEAQAAIESERNFTQRLGEVTAQLSESNAARDKEEARALDEIVRNPAVDIRSLATHLQPWESEVRCLSNARDALAYRYLPAARLRRLETTLEQLKLEALEAQVLAAISWCRTAAAMKTVLQEEGSAVVSGKRTDSLRAAATEKMRLVNEADAALREERNRQLETAQVRSATGIITRAETNSAIPALMGHSIT